MKHYSGIITRAIVALALTPFMLLNLAFFTCIGFLVRDPNDPSAWLFFGWLNWVTFGVFVKK